MDVRACLRAFPMVSARVSAPSRRVTDFSQPAGSLGVMLWLCIIPARVGPGPN